MQPSAQRKTLKSKRAMLSLLVILLTSPVQAADVPRMDLASWNSCLKAASESDEATNAEEIGGKVGYHEFLVEKCGFRPIVRMPNGKIALSDEDCATLYQWIEDGACMPDEFSFSTNQSLIAKQLNNRIFSFEKFAVMCKARDSKNSPDDFSSFRKEMCESAVKP